MPSNNLLLDKYLARGLQEGEHVLPDDSANTGMYALPNLLLVLIIVQRPQASLNSMMLRSPNFRQWDSRSFDARKPFSQLATVIQRQPWNGYLHIWMTQVFFVSYSSHYGYLMLLPDIDAPLQAAAADPSAEQVSMLADMGFTTAQSRKALKETVRSPTIPPRTPLNFLFQDGNPERAVEWLFSHPDDTGETVASAAPAQSHPGGDASLPARYRLKAFISHKGPSVHSGHYVAHIRMDDLTLDGPGEWVLFNDEKVVKADLESVEDLKKSAYLYIFEKLM